MKFSIGLIALFIIVGCTTNKPLTSKQVNAVKKSGIVLKKTSNLPELPIYSTSDKVGAEVVAGATFGLLTGSFSISAKGKTPRTRFNKDNLIELSKSGIQKANADKLEIMSPSDKVYEKLSTHFNILTEESEKESEVDKNQLTITIKPIVWHLFYDSVFNEEKLYYLEYASDINMSSPNNKINRKLDCDKQSEKPLSKKIWINNDMLKIKEFIENISEKCSKLIFSELYIQ